MNGDNSGKGKVECSVIQWSADPKNPVSYTHLDVYKRQGYYTRKTIDESVNGADNLQMSNGMANYIFFRYADVLLMYAEASLEAGDKPTAVEYLDMVRTRGGNMPSIDDTYPLGITENQLREIIRRDRRIELAFEDKRWWDILRWKICDGENGVMNKPIGGMKIEDKRCRRDRYTTSAAAMIALTWMLAWYMLVGSETPSYTEITVPKGQRVHLTLPDGSEAWLSSLSTLRWPSVFSSDARMVEPVSYTHLDVYKRQK